MSIIPSKNDKRLPPDLLANSLLNKQKVIELVKEIVANYYGIPIHYFELKSRKVEMSTPRHVAMHIIRKHAGQSITLEQIGKQFGNRNHATVLHAANRIADLATVEWKLRKELEEIELILKTRQADSDFASNLSKDVYYLNLSNITVLQISKNSSIVFTGISNTFIQDLQKLYFHDKETTIKELKDTGLFILEKQKEEASIDITNDNNSTYMGIQQ